MSVFRFKRLHIMLKDFGLVFHLGETQNSINSAKESLGIGPCVRSCTSWCGGRRYRTAMNNIAVVAASGVVFSNSAFAHIEPKFLELNSVSIEKILHLGPEFVPLRNFLVSDTGLNRREYGTKRSSGGIESLPVSGVNSAEPSNRTADNSANESKKGFGHGISNVIALIAGIFMGHRIVMLLTFEITGLRGFLRRSGGMMGWASFIFRQLLSQPNANCHKAGADCLEMYTQLRDRKR